MHLKQLKPHLEEEEYAINTLYILSLLLKRKLKCKEFFHSINREQLDYTGSVTT